MTVVVATATYQFAYCQSRSKDESAEVAMLTSLPSDYQAFIHASRYARWIESEERRESWPETIARWALSCYNMPF